MAGVPPPVPSLDELRAVARLDAVGVTSAAPFDDTRAVLEERRRAGLHGGMAFTYRNPARSTTPSRALEGARAIVVGAHRYRRTDPAAPDGRSAVVARYARDDHYAELRRRLDAVAAHLGAGGWRSVVVVDDNALVDRAAAVRAGLGWYGKSGNVLIAGRGSWFVLGSVITDAPLPPTDRSVADGCGTCVRCIDACPTGAIVAPGVVDARRCLAWLVQQAGSFPMEHRSALGGRIYGCDDCQEVCPPNRTDDRRDPPPPGDTEGAWVDLVALLALDDPELLARHGRWYIPARDPRYVRRNAIVALGNIGDGDDPAVVATLARYRSGDDALLAEHADWAMAQLS
jgi:epoxyqueuosine reductase